MVKLASPAVPKSEQLDAVVWAALEKVAHKQKESDSLPEGSKHTVNLEMNGTVDGEPFEKSFSSVLSIGHRQTRSSSVNPQVPQLIAWILGKLNRATRNRVLLDLPDEFLANGKQMPEPSPVLVSEVEHLLKQLRRTKTVEARGSVRCEYSI